MGLRAVIRRAVLEGPVWADLVNGTKTAATATGKCIMPTASVSTYSVSQIVAEEVFLLCGSTPSRRTCRQIHDMCRGGVCRPRQRNIHFETSASSRFGSIV